MDDHWLMGRQLSTKQAVLHCAFLLALTSCVTTYTDFPVVNRQLEPLSGKESAMYYHVDPLSYLEQAMRTWRKTRSSPLLQGTALPIRATYEELERVFEQNRIFTKAIAISAPPEKGIFCAVEVIYKPPSTSAHLFTALTFGSIFPVPLFFVPSYSGESGHIVKYNLYVDQEMKKTYEYQITRKEAAWFGLLPFVWVNLLTPSEREAFRATAYQFFLDAQQDGYFN